MRIYILEENTLKNYEDVQTDFSGPCVNAETVAKSLPCTLQASIFPLIIIFYSLSIPCRYKAPVFLERKIVFLIFLTAKSALPLFLVLFLSGLVT